MAIKKTQAKDRVAVSSGVMSVLRASYGEAVPVMRVAHSEFGAVHEPPIQNGFGTSHYREPKTIGSGSNRRTRENDDPRLNPHHRAGRNSQRRF